MILAFEAERERVLVRTVQEAADALMRKWLIDDGEEFLAAVKACLDVMARKAEPEDLRAALIRAADEADVTVVTVLH